MSWPRIRNFIIMVLLIIVAFVIQSTIISKIHVLGCAPNLILVLTFIYGYSNGKISGMLMGFFGGLIMDVFFCEVIGYNALVLLAIGFISGMWNRFFYSDNLYIPLLMLIGSDLLYCLLYYFFWFALRAKFNFGFYFIHIILPEFLLTFLAGVILYKPLIALTDKLRIYVEK